jgi:hypothetical protein
VLLGDSTPAAGGIPTSTRSDPGRDPVATDDHARGRVSRSIKSNCVLSRSHNLRYGRANSRDGNLVRREEGAVGREDGADAPVGTDGRTRIGNHRRRQPIAIDKQTGGLVTRSVKADGLLCRCQYLRYGQATSIEDDLV